MAQAEDNRWLLVLQGKYYSEYLDTTSVKYTTIGNIKYIDVYTKHVFTEAGLLNLLRTMKSQGKPVDKFINLSYSLTHDLIGPDHIYTIMITHYDGFDQVLATYSIPLEKAERIEIIPLSPGELMANRIKQYTAVNDTIIKQRSQE